MCTLSRVGTGGDLLWHAGWQARGHYASSGRAIGTADTTLVIPSVKVQGLATLKYKCAVDRRLKVSG